MAEFFTRTWRMKRDRRDGRVSLGGADGGGFGGVPKPESEEAVRTNSLRGISGERGAAAFANAEGVHDGRGFVLYPLQKKKAAKVTVEVGRDAVGPPGEERRCAAFMPLQLFPDRRGVRVCAAGRTGAASQRADPRSPPRQRLSG